MPPNRTCRGLRPAGQQQPECLEAAFADLAHIFDPPEARRDAGAVRPPAGCAELEALGTRMMSPEPQVSLSAHALAGAAGLEAIPFADPAMMKAARDLAAHVRRCEPALRRVDVPAAEMVARMKRMTEQAAALRKARAQADEHAAELRGICPVR